MEAISELIGINPAELSSAYVSGRDDGTKPLANEVAEDETIDETNLQLDPEEVKRMAEAAATAVNILDQLQTNSVDFEMKIRQLSQEMNVLESQSSSLHHRLLAREEALALLEPLLQEYTIPSQVVNTLYEGEMDAAWYAALDRVRRPLNTENKGAKWAQEAQKLRAALISRALERLKVFYVAKLRTLRRPGVDAQSVQAEIVRARIGMDLLRTSAPRLAISLASAYRNTMKWYYGMLFGKYGRWLSRQPLAPAITLKLLGSAINQGGAESLFSMSVSSAKSVDAFSVGARPTVLLTDNRSAPPLPMTATLPASASYYPIEVLVRSMLLTLGDSFEMESQVEESIRASKMHARTDISANSGARSPSLPASPVSPSRVSSPTSPSSTPGGSSKLASPRSFVEIFEPTLAFYSEVLAHWIAQSSADLFGLLLVIRLVERSQIQKWAKPWLDSIAKKCWPHVLSICEQQAKSIEHAALKASTVSSTENHLAAPHILTQLVSSYLSGILQLCTEEPETPLANALNKIVESYELFISKFAAGNEKVLHNNYFVMSSLLSDIDGSLAGEFANHFQLLVKAYSS